MIDNRYTLRDVHEPNLNRDVLPYTELPDEVVRKTSDIYQEVLTRLTHKEA